MPASEDRRGKWKRRKRGGRRPKQEEEDMEEEHEDNNNEEMEDADNADELHQNGGATPDPGPGVNEVVEDSGTRISDFPSVVRRVVIRPHASVTAVVAAERAGLIGESRGQGSLPSLENISYGQLQALSTVPADSVSLDTERSDGASSAYVISPPLIMEGEGVVKRFGDKVHVLPMHSAWFAPNTVDRLERQVVPQFFSGKSPHHTPESYMHFRNAIVSKYTDNPEKTLTISDCQGLVDGVDDEDFARVFRFLDHWGIINYCATSQCHPEPSRDISDVREDSNGEVHVPSAALTSIESLIKFDKPSCGHKSDSSVSCSDVDLPDLDIRIREHLCDNHCNHCSRPLPTVYFQSQKKEDVLLCSDCFHHARFVAGHSCIDFVRVDTTKQYGDQDGENWSDQETLLLLEAVELYNENWVQIADHVGSKSKAQCILHFLRLPVEDGLLDNVELPGVAYPANPTNGYDHKGTDSNGALPGSSEQESETEINLPFVKSPNPVMALVAFLASAVGPRVASSCAHESLMVLSADDRFKSEGKDPSLIDETTCQNGAEAPTPLPQDKVMAAFRAGLSAAATKAKLFADHEEREIQRLSANIVNHQLKRMELKLKQFAEIETLLMKECEQVEKTRQRFAAERARMVSARFGSPGQTSNTNNLQGMSLSTGGGNNINTLLQQQQGSASSSQPSIIPGFSNNPQLHAQMQFMARQQQQQQAFSFGPRLPLNAIQTNAGSTPSLFGNNQLNNNPAGSASINQPPFSHPMVRSSTGSGSGSGLGLN
ncbi:PREDICTED: SWI/SNF complex subunit SWI3C [Brassica oleracea var. oleracea]|uniref:SWI/SNF complex subunit SWI3C n=1 Tax=Brassica oleracea var. oleracea TaxID=109376 RepID=A0A0D3CC66_BRAOL|nr:PREDICTED: SWI/SNF complex subunit SWI3C [Brassica oleracea var. oleracea]